MSSASLPPGSRLPRAFQGALWAWSYPEWTARLHARHGATFSVSVGGLPAAVVTTDGDAVRRLLTGDPLQRRHGNDLVRPILGEHSLMVLEPAAHLARRKLLLPPFHGDSVRGYARLMEDLVERELSRWRPDSVVEVLPRARDLTLAVILRAVFGISDPVLAGRLQALIGGMIDVPGSAIGFYFPRLFSRSSWNLPARAIWRLKGKLDALLLEQIRATRGDPALGQREDILAVLLRARGDSGEQLSDSELLDELTTLLVAGHETTATGIAWGVELLVRAPEVLARARVAALEQDDSYLDALVKEVLRMRPPTGVTAARQILEPFQIDRWVIEPGTPIVVDGWGIHHDPALYPAPELLQPERFLDRAPPDAYSFLPFGGGAHRCIGAALAQLEMRVALGAILRRFELRPALPREGRAQRRTITLVPRGGARVLVSAARATSLP